MTGGPMRKVDELFERYGESHRNPANKAIHWICVPLIVFSVIGGAAIGVGIERRVLQ